MVSTADGLSRMANLSIDEVKSAVKVLESPDTRATDPQEFDGKRVEKVQGGWKILNHAKYRDEVQREMKRVRDQRAQAAKRERDKLSAARQCPTAGELHDLNQRKQS